MYIVVSCLVCIASSLVCIAVSCLVCIVVSCLVCIVASCFVCIVVNCLVCIVVNVFRVLLSSYAYLLYYVCIVVFTLDAGLLARRSCNRPPRHRFFLFSLCL